MLTTFKAKGLVPDTNPLGAGVFGRSGTPVASWLMNESDVVIAVGVSFSNHTGIATYKPVVQIDDDPAAIGRFDPIGVGLVGDAGATLTAVSTALVDVSAQDQRPEVAEFIEYYLNNASKLVKEVKYIPLSEQDYRHTMANFTSRKTGTAFGGEPEIGVTIAELLRREPKE